MTMQEKADLILNKKEDLLLRSICEQCKINKIKRSKMGYKAELLAFAH